MREDFWDCVSTRWVCDASDQYAAQLQPWTGVEQHPGSSLMVRFFATELAMSMMLLNGHQTQFPLLFPLFHWNIYLFFYNSDSKNSDFPPKFCVGSSICRNPDGCCLCSTVLSCEGVVCVRVCPNDVVLLSKWPVLSELLINVCILPYGHFPPCVGKQPSKFQVNRSKSCPHFRLKTKWTFPKMSVKAAQRRYWLWFVNSALACFLSPLLFSPCDNTVSLK